MRMLLGALATLFGSAAIAQVPAGKPPAVEDRVRALIALLADPEASRQKLKQTNEVIDELVAIGEPAAPLLVRAVIQGQKTAGPYSLLALERIGTPAVPHVRAAWPALSAAERWKLMRFRGEHDYAPALEFALESLGSRDNEIVKSAARYVGGHKEAKARGPLLKGLDAAPAAARWDVIKALGQIGGEDAVAGLVALLKPTGWAAKGAGLRPPQGVPPSWWPDGRPEVIAALGAAGSKSAITPLLDVLREKGAGRAYLGQRIIPVLVELNAWQATPELRRIAAADPKTICLTCIPGDEEIVKRMAAEAAQKLAAVD